MSREVSIKIGPRNSFVRVRLPKGVSSPASPKIQRAIENSDQRISTNPKCDRYFVRKGGGYKLIQRCSDRTLKASALRRFKKNRPCVSGTTKRFVKCSAGARRARLRR
jgi:hypothetical protein